MCVFVATSAFGGRMLGGLLLRVLWFVFFTLCIYSCWLSLVNAL